MAKDLTDLSPVRQPVDRASGLPNPHYIDDGVYVEERDALLFANWSGLAVAADVPEPGDAKPIDFLGQPLLLLRDLDNQVRVFLNICRHRGMILVDAPRKIEGPLRCPYHSWCYKLSGELVSTPHIGGPGHNTHDAVDPGELGLVEVRSHIWRDVVWINISGDAAPFEDVHADLIARWSEFDQPHYHGGADSQFTLRVDGNWKLAVENYCESYHLPWIHPGLNSYSRLEDHYNIEAPGLYSGQGTLVYKQLVGDENESFPDFADLSDKWDTGAEYVAVYPNVLLAAHRDHAYAMILIPEGPAHTREETHLYYATPNTPASLRDRNRVQWHDVLAEDIFVVEGMQKGRHA
ncbi:MAG: aromatic ring-hydroxylating dioxygenase subunit alpha, partial [Pseudomonadota bacterium]